VISGESASDVTDTSATISWITDEPSTSQVEYWPGSLSALDKTLVTSHSVTLTNLAPGTTYYYKTMSADDAGNLAVSDERTFTTSGVAPDTTPPVISDVPLDPSLVTSHSVTLTDLTPEATYHYKVKSADATGNLAVSDEYTFTTLAAPAPANWALIGGIIAGVVVAGGLAWYLLWWRRRGSYIG
jgi:chitodextrinase